MFSNLLQINLIPKDTYATVAKESYQQITVQFGYYRLLNLEETCLGDSKFCGFCIFSINYTRAKCAIPFFQYL